MMEDLERRTVHERKRPSTEPPTSRRFSKDVGPDVIYVTYMNDDNGVQTFFSIHKARPHPEAVRYIRTDRSKLLKAVKDVLEHWDTPMWKKEVSTASVMNRLRDAFREIEDTER